MINRTEDHRLAIENPLSHLLWHDGVRQETGLAGLSQVWDEDPAWYFWLRGVPGALLLRLIACEPMGTASHSTFLIHHFHGLADPENESLLASGIFDGQTGTPRFERRHEVYDRFIDGEIGLSLTADRQPLLTCCSFRRGGGTAARALYNVLMEALAFFRRDTPGRVCRGRPAPGVRTVFAIYDQPYYRRFLAEMAAAAPDFPLRPPPSRWRKMAAASGHCTAGGTCGCGH